MKPSLSKIFIIGTSASGKSTLAKIISKEKGIPHYPLDDIFWYKKYSKKRDPKKRDKIIFNLIKRGKGIFEGVYGPWTEELVKKSDLVIWLDYPPHILSWRLIKRFLTEKERKPGQDLKNLFRLIRYVGRYKEGTHDGSYISHRQLIDKYKPHLIIIKNNHELIKFLERIRGTYRQSGKDFKSKQP